MKTFTKEYELQPFSPSPRQVSGSLSLNDDRLTLKYRVTGDTSAVVAQEAKTPSSFRDGLWQTTCFELFLCDANSPRYLEWNFSTEGYFAVYAFSDIRCRLGSGAEAPAQANHAPLFLNVSRLKTEIVCSVEIPIGSIDLFVGKAPWRFQPTAVLAIQNGDNEYWAPSHPGVKPDFHSFASL